MAQMANFASLYLLDEIVVTLPLCFLLMERLELYVNYGQRINELFLMNQWAGLKEKDFASRCNICSSHCIFTDQTWKTLPDTRVVMDSNGAQVPISTPPAPSARARCPRHTGPTCPMKGFTGMALHGLVTFVTSLYGGSVKWWRTPGLDDRGNKFRMKGVKGEFSGCSKPI